MAATAKQLGNDCQLFARIPSFCSGPSYRLQNRSICCCKVSHAQRVLTLIERDLQQLAALASQWVPCASHSQHSPTSLRLQSFTSVWPIFSGKILIQEATVQIVVMSNLEEVTYIHTCIHTYIHNFFVNAGRYIGSIKRMWTCG